MCMQKHKRQYWQVNQSTGDAFGGPGLAVGGDFSGNISGGTFTGGNATSGSNSVTR